jgi:MFS family permease
VLRISDVDVSPGTHRILRALFSVGHVTCTSSSSKGWSLRIAAVAWLVAAIFYSYQYALRSAPSVMMAQLSEAFGLGPLGVASILSLFYYGYSGFSLLAGTAIDRWGPRRLLPGAAAAVGIGAVLLATGDRELASIGRFLQGAGGVFALVAAIYLATTSFPPSRAATLIGATQMFGMAGGSAGQFVVGPLIQRGLSWQAFWIGMGLTGLAIAALLVLLLPKDERKSQAEGWMKGAVRAIGVVFRNPQSILCGFIAGLMMMPTSIFDMIWGVRFLQEARGFEYPDAVLRSATVPLGWIVGCPVLGFLSDRLGRRKPVMAGGAFLLLLCLAFILYGPTELVRPYSLGLLAGFASGAALLPYTVVKEANPPEFGGTATGVVNFLNFTLAALLGPVFGWLLQELSGESAPIAAAHYQTAFTPLLCGVALAIVLVFFLKETGPAKGNSTRFPDEARTRNGRVRAALR